MIERFFPAFRAGVSERGERWEIPAAGLTVCTYATCPQVSTSAEGEPALHTICLSVYLSVCPALATTQTLFGHV